MFATWLTSVQVPMNYSVNFMIDKSEEDQSLRGRLMELLTPESVLIWSQRLSGNCFHSMDKSIPDSTYTINWVFVPGQNTREVSGNGQACGTVSSLTIYDQSTAWHTLHTLASKSLAGNILSERVNTTCAICNQRMSCSF